MMAVQGGKKNGFTQCYTYWYQPFKFLKLLTFGVASLYLEMSFFGHTSFAGIVVPDLLLAPALQGSYLALPSYPFHSAGNLSCPARLGTSAPSPQSILLQPAVQAMQLLRMVLMMQMLQMELMMQMMQTVLTAPAVLHERQTLAISEDICI